MEPVRKNIFRGMDVKTSAPPAPAQAEPKKQADGSIPQLVLPAPPRPVGKRQASREGKKVVTFYLEPEQFKALKNLSTETGLPVQKICESAIDYAVELYKPKG